MRTIAILALGLFACRTSPSPSITSETSATVTTNGDAACTNPCGPAPATICCGARDKCCAEGVAAHFYCYSGPGDCPARP